MTCPDHNLIGAYVDGLLPEAEAAPLLHHLVECRDCREDVAQLDAMRTSRAAPKAPTTGAGRRIVAARLRSTDPLFEAGQPLGRFSVIRRLGTGAMGVVLAAYDAQLDRNVAIKVVRPSLHESLGAKGMALLRTEAQAMARLTHPNVVPVYDVGTWGGQFFLAMELVEGETLRRWVARENPSRASIVAACLDAARGLHAAHCAGIIHRDFKPDNVLQGTDGRVRVTDFGLAQLDAPPSREPHRGCVLLGARHSPSTAGEPAGRSDGVAGTRAYMAPEVLRGQPASERSDQFSFCVSMYELLVGHRPFEGPTVAEPSHAVDRRPLPVPDPKLVRARALLRALRRGMHRNPRRRYPSMAALVGAVERATRDQPCGRRVAVGLGFAVTAGILILATGGVDGGAPACPDPASRLADVWDDPVARSIEHKYAAAGRSSATFERLQALLDTYAHHWRQTHHAVCEAAAVGDLTDEGLDRRMHCLGQHLAEVRVLTHALLDANASAFGETAEHVLTGAYALSPIDDCAKDAQLPDLAVPADPRLRGTIAEIEAALARARQQKLIGDYVTALPALRRMLPDAEATGHDAIVARVSMALAGAEMAAGDADVARTLYRETIHRGTAARADALVADAWLALARLNAAYFGRPQDGLEQLRMAKMANDRAGGAPGFESDIAFVRATLLIASGDYKAAVDVYEGVLQARRRQFQSPHVGLEETLAALGNALVLDRRFPDAVAHLTEALQMGEALYGTDHHVVAETMRQLSHAYLGMGDGPRARDYAERALAQAERSYGVDSPGIGPSLGSLVVAVKHAGDDERALALIERELQIYTKAGVAESRIAEVQIELAATLDRLGRDDEALALYAQADAAVVRSVGPEHIHRSFIDLGAAAIHAEHQRWEVALEHYRRALAATEHVHGADHPHAGFAVSGIAQCLFELGAYQAAIDPAEQAVRLFAAEDPELLARAKFQLARLLWDADAGRARALALARQAKHAFQAAAELGSAHGSSLLTEVTAWLTQSGRASG